VLVLLRLHHVAMSTIVSSQLRTLCNIKSPQSDSLKGPLRRSFFLAHK
jgi:hypothetical protein